jgi:F-type H+-transporting ATPase subunit a
VFLNNVSGLVPGNESPMSNINGTGSLALMVLVISQCSGLLTHGLHHFKNLVPSGIPVGILPFMVPLEIISLLAKPFSLAIRLFANMFAGHAVLMIFAGLVVSAHPLIKFLPFGGVLLISVFEVFVSFIQAFIFVYLTSLYVGDAVHADH